ncbi:pathogenesis-related thaumatin-like protein 3.5 [Impatiens glandulifera]|uniref:pathogenesis-related thaumatin-like protein 3.5 n=1 Tax=Impatiens glandulifera TaxID=253017 RepID=UPI001FB16B02|nr:pathogenesis-related thaumatin-like protein 3.5 [Impatiens glandulifera]
MAPARLLFLFFLLGNTRVFATIFTLENRCSYTVWPGTLSANGAAILAEGGLELPPGSSTQFSAPFGWSGRFWARTGCQFDDSQRGNCATGDCGTGLRCVGGGAPPVTLAEFTLGSGPVNEKDFYDVSLVDGHNVGIGIHPIGSGDGECHYAGCVADVNGGCPPELRIAGENGEVVACKSACAAFDSPEFCCTGEHSTPATCSPTEYSTIFKSACPTAYSYAYDDASSTRTCSGSDYLISFCPTGS